jgi:hypothetical protein
LRLIWWLIAATSRQARCSGWPCCRQRPPAASKIRSIAVLASFAMNDWLRLLRSRIAIDDLPSCRTWSSAASIACRATSRAARRGNEFSPLDVNGHATLPLGHPTRGTISRFNRAVGAYFTLDRMPRPIVVQLSVNADVLVQLSSAIADSCTLEKSYHSITFIHMSRQRRPVLQRLSVHQRTFACIQSSSSRATSKLFFSIMTM